MQTKLINIKTAFIASPNICPRSQVNTATLVEYLKANGWSIIDDFKKADLILLGLCGFDKFREDRSIEYLSVVKRKYYNSLLIVYGCLADINEKRLLDQFNVISIGPKHFDKLDNIIGSKIKFQEIKNPNIIKEYSSTFIDGLNLFERLYVKSRMSILYPFHALSRISFGSGVKPLHFRYDSVFDIKIANGCLG